MATFQFRLSSKKNKLGRQELLMRFYHGKFQQRAKTGIFIEDKPNYWDGKEVVNKARSATDEVQYHREQKERLDNLCRFILEQWGKVDNSNVRNGWLEEMVDRFNYPEKYMTAEEKSKRVHFTQVFVDFVAHRNVSEYREKHFWTMWRLLRRYELFQGVTFEFETFSHDDLEGFRSFLINEHEYWTRDEKTNKMKCSNRRYLKAYNKVNDECLELGRKIDSRCAERRSKNTLNNILVILKCFWLWCMKEGYTERNPFNKFKIDGAEYGTPFYITQEERLQLEAAPLEGTVAVQRDIFIFQSYVGCRVGDLYKFTYDNIVEDCLKYTPRKTKDNNPVLVEVPLISKAKKLIEKYYDPQRGTLFPFISQQKYNIYIKKAFQEAGLNRNVAVLNPMTRQYEMKPLYEVATSHMARRTFTGIAYSLVQDPNIIASMTGHAEGSKAFNRYRKIDMSVKKSLMDQLDK
jgi:integrase